MSISIKQEIVEQIDKLPIELQKQVLDFVHNLVSLEPKGISGKEISRFLGIMTAEEAKEISDAIQEGCERIDDSGW